ncbi:hypothetical protein BAUCODRAFT_28735 [Baudoinia panamericana UAMH 10762]|uniref:Uncharacterized protein n=1 Tax=Baudoinia panamericana (strain UAMH 10762) TaxID=717646 RepID=M2NLL6_BAUPA|nr:uncharacterized protein BAUCODRAFT_28735 [Baudoinia panamericana UAMH 10762]EMD00385.1 hypothetical protein BAUCODRAFT_28735 [Baudoinia panamericana UAMH 10762]
MPQLHIEVAQTVRRRLCHQYFSLGAPADIVDQGHVALDLRPAVCHYVQLPQRSAIPGLEEPHGPFEDERIAKTARPVAR